MVKEYDVIIIGAGPGGLNCALKLSNTNKKVLLLEQNKEIGPKVCAGGLTGKDISQLKIPKEIMDFESNKVVLHTPLMENKIKLDNPFIWTVDRKKLGQWQLNKLANKKNVEVRTETKVTKIEEDNTITINNSEKIKFKYLIGADGSNSIVRRYLKLKTEKQDIAMQYIIPTRKYKKFEVFWDSEKFYVWYAWIFPHKDYVSVGVGCDPKIFSSKKLQKNFKKWLKEQKIDTSKGKCQAHVINYDFQGYKFGKIFLVGDAAGFASGLTGEGIYQAMISGEEIAKIILNKNYIPKKIEKLLETKRLHNDISLFLEKSGAFREVEIEIFTLLLKSNFITKKMLKYL